MITHAWGVSSAGRALASHVRGHGFESRTLHHYFANQIEGFPLDSKQGLWFLEERTGSLRDQGNLIICRQTALNKVVWRLFLGALGSKRAVLPI